MRRRLLLILAAALACSAEAPRAPARPPNVVVILSDDQGYADVGFHPRPAAHVRTPHLDALARSGVVFSQAYAASNVCAPSRAGLLTGRYPQRFGIYTAYQGGSGIPLEERFLPEYLSGAGYVSGAVGKWHLGVAPRFHPLHRGFDSFYGFLGRGIHDYFALDDPDDPIYRDLTPVADRGYLTDRISDEAVAFIERHRAQPFFLYVAYNAVHSPAQAPADEIQPLTGDPTRDTLLAMLRRLDAGVGRIADALGRAGLREDTLLFFLSDNGGARAMRADNGGLRGFKGRHYEGGIRVPFAVSWPSRIDGGRRIDAPVSLLDVLPTALDATGVAPPEGLVLDGRSLLPLLRGEAAAVHDALFWSDGGRAGNWAVRAGRWKLVVARERVELFDLVSDPGERRDLSASRPERVEALRARYDRWLDAMAAPRGTGPKRWSPAPESAASPSARAMISRTRRTSSSTGVFANDS